MRSVDELGYLRLSREANYLIQLVAAPYDRSRLFLTSDKSFRVGGGGVYPDPPFCRVPTGLEG